MAFCNYPLYECQLVVDLEELFELVGIGLAHHEKGHESEFQDEDQCDDRPGCTVLKQHCLLLDGT